MPSDKAFYEWWSVWVPEQRSTELTAKMAAKAAWYAGLAKADEISNDVGMKCYENGDKAGWAACDEVGHIIRQDFE